MAKYATRVISATPAGAGAYCAIRSNAGTGQNKQGMRPRISRIACMLRTAVQADIDVYRVGNANYGTQNLTQAGQSLQATDPVAGTTVDYGWAPTAPSLPNGAVPIDGTRIAGTVASGYIFVFPDPVVLEPDTALLLWSPGIGPQLVVVPTWDE